MLFFSVVALFTSFCAAFGATNTFEAGTNWNTGTDWSSGNVPGATDALLISLTAYGGFLPNITLDNSFSVQALCFDTGTDDISIDANANGTTAQTVTFSGGTNALGGTDAVALSPATTGTITFGGNPGLGSLNLAFGNNPATINVANSAATLVFGPNLVVAGANGLTKDGSGTLSLGGISAYTGNTAVNAGTLAITGAVNTQNNNFTVDGSTTNPAVATLNGAGSVSTYNAYVGYNGAGSFLQTGGTNTNGNALYLGYNAGSNGTYCLSAGSLQTTSVYSQNSLLVGYSGSGGFVQTGGTNNSSYLAIAENVGSIGSYSLSAGSLNSDNLFVGASGLGTFVQTGGSSTLLSLSIGDAGGSIGSYNLIGGSLTTSVTSLTVGVYKGSSGSFNQTGGSLSASGGVTIAYDEDTIASYNLSAGSLQCTTTYVGSGGTGSFIQTGGSNNGSYILYLGQTVGGNGTYNLSGGSLQSSNTFAGYSGMGSFIQTGGTNTIAGGNYINGGLCLGENAGSGGTYTLSGGLLQTPYIIGASGTSLFNFNGGILRAGGSSATFITGLNTANVQAGGAIVDTNGFSITISQTLLHDMTLGAAADGGLTEIGLGILTLTAANMYTGPTSVTAGTLVLASGGSLAGTGVTVGGTSAATFQIIGGNSTIGTSGAASITLSANTGTLSLADGIIDNLTIGGGGSSPGLFLEGGDSINLDVSGTTADSIALGTSRTASVTGTNAITPTFLSLASGTNVLISAPGGGIGTSGSFVLPGNGAYIPFGSLKYVGSETLVNTGTTLALAVQINPIPVTAYFTGTFGTAWSTINGSGTSGQVNFSNDSAGQNNAGQLPYTTTNVHFYSTNGATGSLATALGGNFTINSLTVDGTSLGNESNPISITGDTLTLEGSGGSGITMNPGAGALTINSVVALGGAQTWTNNSSNPLTVSGTSLTGSFGLTVSGSGNTVISAPIITNGTNGLTKGGAGILTLTALNTFVSSTKVLAGTLLVTGTLSSSDAVTVGDPSNLGTSAILAGTGKVGPVTLGAAAGNTGAEVEPSNGMPEVAGSSSSLTVTSFTIGAASQAVLALEIGRILPGLPGAWSFGDSSDRIVVTGRGAVSLDSSADLLLTLQSGYSPSVGDIMYLITGAGSDPYQFGYVNGVAISSSNTFTLGGDTFAITNAANAASSSFVGGHDEAVKVTSVVPEPSTWTFFGCSLLFLRGIRHLRQRRPRSGD